MHKPMPAPRELRLSAKRVVAAAVIAVASLSAPAFTAAADHEPKREPHVATELVLRALTLLGVNYKFGGNSPDSGLDCSGLVRHVFREAVGLVLPRRAEEISRAGEPIAVNELRPGDLVFFNTLRRAFSHVGIYIGNNQFVHAPSSGGEVRVESLSGSYWTRRFNGARRLLAGEQVPADAQQLVSAAAAAQAAGSRQPVVENGPFRLQ